MPGNTPTVGDLIKLRVYTYLTDQVGINTTYWAVGGAAGGGLNLQAIANAFDDVLDTPYINWLPTEASYLGVTTQNISPPITAPFFGITGADFGVVSGGYTSRQLSGLIHIGNTLGGHSNRGRLYIPFIAKANTTGTGTLNGGGQTALLDIAVAYDTTHTFTSGGASTTLMGAIYHRVDNTYSFTERIYPDSAIATQRRRGSFGKQNTLPF